MASKRSWSDIVVPYSQRLQNKEKEKVVAAEPVILCENCKIRKAYLCSNCKKRPVRYDIPKEPLCGGCHTDYIWNHLGSESMCIGYIRDSDRRNDPPFRCKECKN